MTKKNSQIITGRPLSQKLRTGRGRKISSQLWLKRQLNDPYVQQAKLLGYRSRAAFKLLQIDEKYHIFKPGAVVIDLGAAPGGWTQVAVQKTGTTHKTGTVIGIDLSPILPLDKATFLEGDFTDPLNQEALKNYLDEPVDVILSDMAASPTGHTQTDHLRTMALAEEAYEFAKQHLKEGGAFVTKILIGGTESQLLLSLKLNFDKAITFKPSASRKDSAEMYFVALGYRK